MKQETIDSILNRMEYVEPKPKYVSPYKNYTSGNERIAKTNTISNIEPKNNIIYNGLEIDIRMTLHRLCGTDPYFDKEIGGGPFNPNIYNTNFKTESEPESESKPEAEQNIFYESDDNDSFNDFSDGDSDDYYDDENDFYDDDDDDDSEDDSFWDDDSDDDSYNLQNSFDQYEENKQKRYDDVSRDINNLVFNIKLESYGSKNVNSKVLSFLKTYVSTANREDDSYLRSIYASGISQVASFAREDQKYFDDIQDVLDDLQ